MNYAEILEEIYAEIQPSLKNGRVANYIPELAYVSPNKFGTAVLTSMGEVFQIGNAA